MLVNNAGATSRTRVSDLTAEEIERTMRLNFTAPAVLTTEALPHIRDKRGNVLFISSAAGTVESLNSRLHSHSGATKLFISHSNREFLPASGGKKEVRYCLFSSLDL